jgi:hypothetical protein
VPGRAVAIHATTRCDCHRQQQKQEMRTARKGGPLARRQR